MDTKEAEKITESIAKEMFQELFADEIEQLHQRLVNEFMKKFGLDIIPYEEKEMITRVLVEQLERMFVSGYKLGFVRGVKVARE